MCKQCGGPKPKGRGRKYCDSCSRGCAEHSAAQRNCIGCRDAWLDRDDNRKKVSIAAQRSRKRIEYGITNEQLDTLLSVERCETCGSEEPLVIDHCHKTGLVRGMLCRTCNLALGNVKDRPETLRALANYLEKY